MVEQCFSKRDSNPPVCGVHRVVVVQKQVSIDQNAPWLGRISCNMCPVIKAVVREVGRFSARNSY